MSLDTQEAGRIKDFIDSGNTYIKAEEKFGINKQAISTQFKRLGITADPYKNKTALTNKQINLAMKMYRNGDTQQKIICNLRVNHKTLNRALKIKGFRVEKKWLLLTDIQAIKIKKMLINGIYHSEINERLGIKAQKIFQYFKKYGGGNPAINYKPTHADYDNLIYFLSNDMTKKAIAFELNTSEKFVRLMICKLGVYPYFEAFHNKDKRNRMLTVKDVFEYINQKFRGETNANVVKKFGVSRVTMDHYLRQSEKMFMVVMESQK